MSDHETSGRTDSFRPILGVSVLLFLAVIAVAGVKSWRDLEAARQRQRLLETRISQTETEIARLRNRIERLRTDPGTLERLAREDLGMVRPGDVVIELPIEGAAPSPQTPPAPQTPQLPRRPPQAVPSPPPPASTQPAPLPAPPTAAAPQPVPARTP